MNTPLRSHWQESAKADVRKLDRVTAMRVFQAIKHYADSGSGDVKELQGALESWRLRAGDYRVLFTIEKGTMQIGGVRHRKESYR